MSPYLSNAAAAYTDASRTTASPQRLLCMLYDRLVLDLDRAVDALRSGESAHAHLIHAQDIVMELLTSLDTTKWDGAARLSSIYVYLHTQLVQANVKRDVAKVVECREHVVPLRDAWYEAAAGGPVTSVTEVTTVPSPGVPR